MSAPDARTRDGFLDRRLTIAQPAEGGHRAGLDAVLLAAALGSDTRGTVIDLGAGAGVAGLSVAARCPAADVMLVESDPATAALALDNAAENRAAVGDRVRVVEADVTAGAAVHDAAGLVRHGASHVIMNPPFHPRDRMRPSPSLARAGAHALEPDDLSLWFRAAARLLDPRGTLTVIFRADELPRLIAAVGGRFGSLAVLPVHPRPTAAASRVILKGRPQGRAPLRLLPAFVLHGPGETWTDAADAVLRGADLTVPWWG